MRMYYFLTTGALYLAGYCGCGMAAGSFDPQLISVLENPSFHEEQAYGMSVVVDGAYALVGAPQEALDSGDPFSDTIGAVHVYRRGDAGWEPVQVLRPPGGEVASGFGACLALDEGVLAVGAYQDASVGFQSGAVHLYELASESFEWRQTLYPDSAVGLQTFGRPVALSGDRLMVGVSGEWGFTESWDYYDGCVNLYRRGLSGKWEKEERLVSPSFDYEEYFGWWADLDGDVVVVGAPYASMGAGRDGVAYVYELQGGQWGLAGVLESSDPVEDGFFGYAMSVHGDELVVGAPWGGEQHGGMVEVFRRGESEWGWVQSLVADDMEGIESFGASLDLLGEDLVIGAPSDSVVGSERVIAGGSVYLAARAGEVWEVKMELAPEGRTEWSRLGQAVSFDGERLLVGAPLLGGHGGAFIYESVEVVSVPENGLPVADVSRVESRVVGGIQGALVRLDGGASSDPDGDALTYVWYVDGQEAGEGMLLDVVLAEGVHELRLVVSGGRDTAEAVVQLEVLGLGLAVELFREMVVESGLQQGARTSSAALLRAVARAIERGNMAQAMRQLGNVQRTLYRVEGDGRGDVPELLAWARKIREAMEP
ncbi:MAG: hypothetical protein ACO34E_12850 [Limisphaerales bacterium]